MTAVYTYATEADLENYSLGETLLEDAKASPEQVATAIMSASRTADGFLGSQYTLPLQGPVPVDLAMHVAWLAGYYLLSTIGFAPEEGSDSVYEKKHDLAMAWLLKVSEGRVTPPGIVGSGSTTPDGSGQAVGAHPVVISGSSRGFSSRGDPVGGVYDLGPGRGGFVGD